ncbi:MAG: hypothetical protein HYZ28_15005 [Myxococcales bacterium]|nr:hypothetical protein [Myxococcales bacterium]
MRRIARGPKAQPLEAAEEPAGTPGDLRSGEDRWAGLVLALSIAAGLIVRLGFALSDDGIYWPDEVHQTLEPAHRLVFGYGLVAWEFSEGARSWALPGMVAGLFRLCALFGLDSPRAYLSLTRLAFCLASGSSAVACVALARRHGARWLSAAVAGALLALMGFSIYLAPRAMGETAAAAPLVLGYAIALRNDAGRRQVWLGAALVGLSVLFRIQCGVFAVGLIGILLCRRRFRAALWALGVLAAFALLYGLLDRLTWGTWFHSAAVYLRFNWLEGKASTFGTAPHSYYTGRLLASLGPLWVAMAVLGLAGILRAPGLGVVTLAFFGLHVLTPHKELRFIYPALPLCCVLSGLGVELLLRPRLVWVGRVAAALAAATAVYSAATFPRLSFGDLGVYEAPPAHSALDAGGPENRLLLAAGERSDLCGLKVLTRDLGYTGGYSYLHRNVPMYGPAGPDPSSRLFNYAVAPKGAVAGDAVEVDSGLELVRLAAPPCEVDRAFDWTLR